MSEYINNNQERVEDFYKFSLGIINGENGTELIKTHKLSLDKITPTDIIAVVDKLMIDKIPFDKLKKGINRILNVVYKTINEFPYDKPTDAFFSHMIAENNELDIRLKKIMPLIKQINKNLDNNIVSELKEKITDLLQFNNHYVKKENVLFPYIEKILPDYRCVNLMWLFDDDIKSDIKLIIQVLNSQNIDIKELNRLFGTLYFTMYAIIFREEKLLFPIAINALEENELNELYEQSFEIGFSFIDTPEKIKFKKQKTQQILDIDSKNTVLDFETGKMTLDQVLLIFNNLPVDVTLIDENDEVKFFSTPPHRIFTRTKAVVGRKVQNCHPPSSVHIVEELLESFKNGTKDRELFWIEMGKMFVFIQYYALRDENGKYIGTLEVSQEVSEIRNLKGEKRLLDA